jgi:hypothetical protein
MASEPPNRRELESDRRSRIAARDEGFELIRRANRWLVAGAVGVTGAVSLWASHAFHPHTTAGAGAAASSTAAASSSSGQQGTGTGTAALQPANPPTATATAPAPAPVVSGGS